MATEDTPTCYAEKAARLIGTKMPDAHVRFFDDGTIDIWSFTDEQFSLFKGLMKLYMDRGKELTPKDRKAWDAVLERDEIRSEEAEEEEERRRKSGQTAMAEKLAKEIMARPVTGCEKCLEDGTIELWSLNEEQAQNYLNAMQEWKKSEEACGRELSPKDRKAWEAAVEMVKYNDAFNKAIKEDAPCPPRPAAVPMSQETQQENLQFDNELEGLKEAFGSWMTNHSMAMEFSEELKRRQLDVVPFDGYTAAQIRRDGAVYPYEGYHVSRVRFLEDGTPDVRTLNRDIFGTYQKYMTLIVEKKKVDGETLSPTDQQAWDAIEKEAKNRERLDKEKAETERIIRVRKKEEARNNGILILAAIVFLLFLLWHAIK